MSTPLYKEALIESKRLRAAALEEAKQAVLEDISPMIKKILDEEIAGSGSGVLLHEQQEEELPPGDALPADPMAAAPAPAPAPPMPAPTAAPAGGTPISPPPGAVDPAMAAPATEVPGPDTTVPPTMDPTPAAAPIVTSGMNVPMPDSSGNITVNFADLFASMPGDGSGEISLTPSEPTLPVDAPPVDMPPSADMPAGMEDLPVDPAASPEEALRESILGVEKKLLGALKTGSVKKALVRESVQTSLFKAYEAFEAIRESLKPADAVLFETYLNSLYGRLLDSDKNSNSYTQRNKDMATKSLKEFAVALFEEIDAQASDAHGPDDGGKNAKKKVVNSNESDKASNHAMKASDSTPVEDPGKKESLTVKESAGLDEEAALEEELREMLDLEEAPSDGPSAELGECDMGEGAASSGHAVVDINVNVRPAGDGVGSVPDALPAVAGGGAEDLEDLGDMGDDDELEIVDDDDTSSSDDETVGDDDEEPHSALVSESAKKLVNENKELKKQLAETQLLTARSLYVNKLFARENLSGGQKRKIVEYLDSARTIQEAKESFLRIKKVLDEAAAGKKNAGGLTNEGASKTRKTGSNSASTSNGGARSTAINEAAQGNNGQWWYAPPSQWQFDANRWAELAGITKKRTS